MTAPGGKVAGPAPAAPGIDAAGAASLARHMDALRDACQPALRFDLAGLPFASWRATLRPRLREALGLPAEPPGAGHTRLLDATEGEWRPGSTGEAGPAGSGGPAGPGAYRWQRVWLRTAPDLWVPACFVLPPEGAGGAPGGRLPVTIACQGHAPDGMRVSLGMVPPETYERSIRQGDRDFALQAVRHGYACLALEMRGFGVLRLPDDASRDAPNSCQRLSSLSLQVGQTLLGGRVHDVGAAIEYLRTRPEVDSGRIVLTGNSGGGTVTLTAGALLEGLAATVPSCAFCTYGDSIQSVTHCPCNYVPGMGALCDMSDLAGLGAPRPQLIVNGREDPIFPIAGVRRAFGRARAIYQAAGAPPDALRLHVGEGGHRYYAAPVWPFLAGALGLPPAWATPRYPAAPPPP